MAQVTAPIIALVNVAELLRHLGDVPPERVRLRPAPGTATEQDLLDACARRPLCELVDGTLVDKTMGNQESLLAARIVHLLSGFVRANDLGMVFGADGLFRMAAGNVRAPDTAVVVWDQLPAREAPDDPIWSLSPALAIEVLSRSNTRREMQAKLNEYFASGTRLVWYIDPQTRSAEQFTSPTDVVQIRAEDSLTGGDVLPGFELPLAHILQAQG